MAHPISRMSLQELQNQVKPITLPDMLALQAKGQQDAADKEKIVFEMVFQQRVIPLLTSVIAKKGVMPVFGCDLECVYSFDNTRGIKASDFSDNRKELFLGWARYVGERLMTIFPDYNVISELRVRPGCLQNLYILEIDLTHKDPPKPGVSLRAFEDILPGL
jgi:hypothetical protein